MLSSLPGGATAVLAATEALPFGVAITDPQGILTWANRAYAQALESTQDELVGQSAGDFPWYTLAHAAPSSEPWRGQATCRRKTGEAYTVEHSITPLRNSAEQLTGFWIMKQDTTELKREAGAPPEAEASLSALIDSTDDLIWSVDRSFGLVTFNKALREHIETNFGVRARVGMGPNDLLTTERAALWPPLYERAFFQGPFRADFPLADGRTLELSFNPIQTDGRTVAVSVFGKDITERKVVEEALREAEAKYRNIFECALEGIFRTSIEGKALTANPGLAKMLGYESPEEVVHAVTDVAIQVWLDPNERSSFVTLLQDQDVVRGYECQFKRKDGTAIWVSLNSRIVRDVEGRPLYIEGFVEDITEHRRMQDALRKSEEKFSRAFQSSPAAITIVDLGTTSYLEVNGAFEQLTGYRRDEVIGRRWDEIGLWVDSSNRAVAVRRLLAGEGLRNWEFGYRKKSGNAGTGLLSAELIEINGKSCAITATIDITERLQLENQLRQAQRLESVGRLAGGVAHDFNNLITVINGYSDLLLKRLTSADPLRPYVEEINGAGEHAASLTKQLLAFSRKQMIEPRALDLTTTIRESASMLQRLIGEDIALETHLDATLGQVMVDADQIHQVIMNLAVNARDAMPDGGILDVRTMNVELDEAHSAAIHDAATPGRYVLMTVTDSGQGMDETILQHIFEPFFTTKELGKGTGLGLATVYGIIRQSGGWIDVESEVGVGTSFKIYLPRIEAGPLPQRNRINVQTKRGTETILLVEDQESVRSFTKTALALYGYHVLEASNADEAIAVSEAYADKIHLLLTDVVLPGMNGKELSTRLKALRPMLKVLFISGYTADVIAYRGVLDPGLSLLYKPFSSDELAGKIRDVLAEVEPSQ